jgi:hypothetical protein
MCSYKQNVAVVALNFEPVMQMLLNGRSYNTENERQSKATLITGTRNSFHKRHKRFLQYQQIEKAFYLGLRKNHD